MTVKSSIILSKLKHITSLLICLALISVVAIKRDNRIMGYSFYSDKHSAQNEAIIQQNGYTIINTTDIIDGIKGFADATPLEIHINDKAIIEKVIPLKNSESPRFFKRLSDNNIYDNWVGLTPKQALDFKVDAVSGATKSSNAVIATFNGAMQYVVNNGIIVDNSFEEFFCLKNIAVLVVILMALILPYIIKDKRYRYIQLLLNIIVLGVWCGTYLSLSVIVNFLSTGINSIYVLIPFILILYAFVLPLFSKQNRYCIWCCPFGSTQEIIHKVSPFKIRVSDKVNNILNIFRKALWCIIMAIMILGSYFAIMDYEIFSIFLFSYASAPVMIIGILFIILSLFVNRPYCKYVCPTGTLLKFSEKK
ncbi:MAG: 4Fe-4S binding protein [Bacteroidales bacterium]|nr:4Fe-4S binding protein [Bacteroidales bacterium]